MGKKRSRSGQTRRNVTASNPFEIRKNKKYKHSVLNRKIKGGDRNVALSRSLAFQRRTKTLLQDVKASAKSNVFNDKRFGENDLELSAEEKLLARFKHARSKKSRYALPEESGATLTHFGKSLGESNEAKLDKEEYKELLEHGEIDHGYKQSSKQDVMKEVMMKAKLFKYERQETSQRDKQLIDQLDEQFTSIGAELLKRDNAEEKYNRKEKEVDDYDLSIKEMRYDERKRAIATQDTSNKDEKEREIEAFKAKQKILLFRQDMNKTKKWPSHQALEFISTLKYPEVYGVASLYLAEAIVSCPINEHLDVVSLVLSIQCILDMNDGKVVPEVIVALEAILGQILLEEDGATRATSERTNIRTFEILSCNKKNEKLEQLEWLRLGVTSMSHQFRLKKNSQTQIKNADEENVSNDSEEEIGSEDEIIGDGEEGDLVEGTERFIVPISLLQGEGSEAPTLEFCQLIFIALTKLVGQATSSMKDAAAVDGLLRGLFSLTTALSKKFSPTKLARTSDASSLPDSLKLVKEQIGRVLTGIISNRKPLKLSDDTPKPIKGYRPLFQETYTWNKYSDEPDKRKAEMKKLKKQINRERKGVARELRRDAVFISEQKEKEKNARAQELRAERLKNRQWLESQSQNLNAAVRDGVRLSGGGSRNINRRGRRK